MTTIAQKIKIKKTIMADVDHHMLITSVFYTQPLTEKSTSEFLVLIVLMMIKLK